MSPGGHQALGLLIDHLHKIFLCTAHILRDSHCAVIAGGEHEPVEEVPQGELVPGLKAGDGSVPGKAGSRARAANRDDIIQAAVFYSDQGCQYLGGAGRIKPCKEVLPVDHLPVRDIEKPRRV